MKKKILFYIICGALFVAGGMTAIVGRLICYRDTGTYGELQPELFAPDTIDTVLYDDETKQIYVCYSDASYVNVYSESGDFLWAVSVPAFRNTYFELKDEKLAVYGYSRGIDYAYYYNSADGTFIEHTTGEGLYTYPEYDVSDEAKNAGITYGAYKVYRTQSVGSKATLVSRPSWYWCMNPVVCLCVSFSGALGVCAYLFIKKKKEYDHIMTRFAFTSRRAAGICRYYRVTSVIHVVYAALNVICCGLLILLIFPLGIHFIFSGFVLQAVTSRTPMNDEEKKVINYRSIVEGATFFIAFISAVVVLAVSSAILGA